MRKHVGVGEPSPPFDGHAVETSRLVGDSEVMRALRRVLRKVAATGNATVLLTGETGTGKDLAAHAIHEASGRAAAPFVNVTCSALQDTLFESELFGHERGAFTDAKTQKLGMIERANGGTLFLDEIGELSSAIQAKLLRFLEEKAFVRVGGATDIRVDVRVITATHRNLKELVRLGRFRADLYYRLSVIEVVVPSLRERALDVPALVRHFVARFGATRGRPAMEVTPTALAALAAYDWPGNIRELRNVVERAALLAEGDLLELEDFGIPLPPRLEGASCVVLPPEGVSLEQVERELVVQALERARGNKTRAAALLHLSRDQLRYKAEKFGLVPPGAPRATRKERSLLS